MEKEKKLEIDFGDILIRERKARKLSLRDLSDFFGRDIDGKPIVSASYLSKIEKKKVDNPSFKIIGRIIEELDLNPSEVFLSFGININNSSKIELEKIFKNEEVYIGDQKANPMIADIIKSVHNALKVSDDEVLIYVSEIIEKITCSRKEISKVKNKS